METERRRLLLRAAWLLALTAALAACKHLLREGPSERAAVVVMKALAVAVADIDSLLLSRGSS